MKDVMVIIGSITYAMKAQRALKEVGIDASLIKREGDKDRGCAYGVRMHASQFLSGIAKLKEMHIDYQVENENKP